MELVRFNPFATAPSINSRINRMFDEFFNDSNRTISNSARSWSPEVDIYEQEGKVVIKADLPGIEKSDISINVEDGILTLKGERKAEEVSEDKTVYRTERFYGCFERAFRLSPKTDVESIEAEFKNGVLHITIPNAIQPAGKEISIH
ncbi:heat-shock protein Hsp20 [Desulfoluna limicola]|uniref:Heat-shock protein Hsp20 n=1 Tax=Desulfoluna limicola TaxID=2810562 RepID=A0ABN6EZB7_9BACT|nr:Hsp20/alpha crystallin family protein [Desulfoluna limicola]BCS95028.1 heat-shock protein Hsp20 [Desulfoluna limicola]